MKNILILLMSFSFTTLNVYGDLIISIADQDVGPNDTVDVDIQIRNENGTETLSFFTFTVTTPSGVDLVVDSGLPSDFTWSIGLETNVASNLIGDNDGDQPIITTDKLLATVQLQLDGSNGVGTILPISLEFVEAALNNNDPLSIDDFQAVSGNTLATANLTVVPEPSAFFMLGLSGLVFSGLAVKRRFWNASRAA